LRLVEEGMKYLKNNLPKNIKDLLDYFDAYYVNGKYRRIGNDENTRNIRFRKLPPLYPPAVWNVNETTLNVCNRTNNIFERFNNKFSKLVDQQHHTIWKLIGKIKNEIKADRAKLALDALGEPEYSSTKRGHNKTVHIRLKQLVKRQNENNLHIRDFSTVVRHSQAN